jgi:sodium/pantothenate symporter
MNALILLITDNPVLFLTIALYLVAMCGIGLWAKKAGERAMHRAPRTASAGFMEEYFLAGRGMGGFTLAMAVITTYTSASSFIGGPGIAYTLGLGWVLLAMIQVPTTFLTLGVMGRRFAAFGRTFGVVTISDFLRRRYTSELLVGMTSVFMIVFFMAVMLAQFIGGARLFQAATGMQYSVGLVLFGITVVAYTTIGGFRAVVLTDMVQGIIMSVASVAVLYGVISAGGGPGAIMDKLNAIDPGLLQPSGANGAISMPFLFSFWILVGLGILGLPQTAQKCLAFKDDAALRKAMIYGTILIGFILLCTHLTGALGRAVLPDLEVGDLVMPTLTLKLMPPFWAGMFIAGVLAAIMSTVSSMMIISSATILRDLYIQWYLKGNEERANPRFVRRASVGITAVLGVCVFILALNPPDLLVWINLFAFGGLEAVFLWPVVLGLYWKRANAKGALSSVLAGLAVFLALTVGKPPMAGVHPIVPALAVSGIAFWLGNRFGNPSEDFEF